MKKASRFLSVLFLALIVLIVVACSQNAGGNNTPVPEQKTFTTKYYMPHGWNETIPSWSAPDVDGAKNLPDAVLSGDGKTEVTNITPELIAALNAAKADKDYFKTPKNIIIIISDGMGISHVKASEKWSGDLIMTQLPNIGAAKTKTRENVTTDSAAGGTAISTGYKTTHMFAAIDAEGNELKTVPELAREQGRLVGIVTNAQLQDATPAVFSVHNKNRSQGWTKIAAQEVVFGADLFMGNGVSSPFSGYFKSSSPLYPFVVANNMKRYTKSADVVSHFSDSEKMWATFNATANTFARYDSTSTTLPNLQQMTYYALSWLDAHSDEDKGFVVMIENTYTDHFGHGSNPVSYDNSPNTYGIVKEVQSTDEAVAIALKYVLEHPDTALIVTADHETGNMILPDGEWDMDFSSIYADSGSHSTQEVPVFAIGKGTEFLNSLAAGKKWYEATPYENAKTGQVIGALLGDSSFGGDVANDSNGKRSPKFEVTTTESTSNLVFTLDLTGVPISSGDLIQFKIKPVNKTDKILVELSSKTGDSESQLAATAFSSKDNETISKDGSGNVKTPLMKAYKQAFIEGSGIATGWYQLSLPASTDSSKITITLTSGSGQFPVGAVIGMDDLTIQYASTFGQIKFTSDKATATGECLVVLN